MSSLTDLWDYQTVRNVLLGALAFWPHLSTAQERDLNLAIAALNRMRDRDVVAK